MMRAVTFLLISLLSRSWPVHANVFSVTPGKVVLSGPFRDEVTVKSRIQCALSCMGTAACKSFNMLSDGHCQMMSPDVACEAESTQALTSVPDGALAVLKDFCPKTCQQMKQKYPGRHSGIRHFSSLPVPVYCDQENNSGGWTLVLTGATKTWTLENVLRRNENTPSLTDDYSILDLGDQVLAHGEADTFEYRLEGQAAVRRLQWGGIWSAPSSASLVHYSHDISTTLTLRLGSWSTSSSTIENVLPWINDGSVLGQPEFVLTTSTDGNKWGSLASAAASNYNPSPWIYPGRSNSGTVLYWIREK